MAAAASAPHPARPALEVRGLVKRFGAGAPILDGVDLVHEVLVVLHKGGETGFMVRDLRLFQDGRHYLPALSLPWVGRQIARRHGQPFDRFWGRHFARRLTA